MYQGSLILTFIISLFDGLNAAGLKIAAINHFFNQFLPMYDIGLGWVLPSILGGIGGYLIHRLRTKNHTRYA
ncbi:hypothetical protein M769_0118090 [Bacillus haynesii]|nr:hypothetical protein M769_0118090 [Bacillus haynesii]